MGASTVVISSEVPELAVKVNRIPGKRVIQIFEPDRSGQWYQSGHESIAVRGGAC